MVSVRVQNDSFLDVHGHALTLYAIALRDPSWRIDDIVGQSEWTTERLISAINYLCRIGLFVCTAATCSGWLAVSVETALEKELSAFNGQIAIMQEEISRRQETITQVLTQFRAVHLRQQSATEVEHVSGEGMAAAIEHAVHAASSEVVVLGGSYMITAIPAECYRLALKRGVCVRIVYRSTPISVPQLPPPLQQVITLGGEVRTATAFPFEVMVVDGSLAFLPAADEFLPSAYQNFLGLMVIRNELTATILRGMFMSCRTEALVVPDHVSRLAADNAPCVSPRQRALLHLLATGMTDKLVGRRLGITERTVRRRVSDLMTLLNAESRFQLGVNASIAGLIDEST
jgi:DNA-binding CsgD family transcriptional regulator